MPLLMGAIALCAVSGFPGLLVRRGARGGELAACLLLLAGCASGVAGVCAGLAHGGEAVFDAAWSVPGGALALRFDPIAAVFLLPLFLVAGAGAVYGLRYWPHREHPANGRKLRLFYGLIAGALALVFLARNGILFLTAWEAMALSGFFLITTEDHRKDARRAGFIYIIATHTGTLTLFALFALLERQCGSFLLPAAGSLAMDGATALFALGLFGFGLKAGLMPLHVWLPGAHAAAPSHASAILSGVMIKSGVYGMVRLVSLFAHLPPWWGWTVLGLGMVSGVMGVALALAQHNIKRLLAYHSVENIGIIFMGLGLAMLGRSHAMPALAALGLAGCLLHVVNHGLFKSLLFLSAGSVIHATGTQDIDSLGGLLKRQRWTGLLFLGGAVAICGLPPFNGFVSEWFIYLGAFRPLRHTASGLHLAAFAAPVLALIGGLALACFVKVFGIVFLGHARSHHAHAAHEAPAAMLGPMAVLLAACAFIGLLPTAVAPLLQAAVTAWGVVPPDADPAPLLAASLAPLGWISAFGWTTLCLACVLGLWLRRRIGPTPPLQDTWGCGYTLPSPRMQYTASSFADSLVRLFRLGLFTRRHGGPDASLFPRMAGFATHTPDAALDLAFTPAFRGAALVFRRVRAYVQNGVAASYLLYIVLTVIVLLTLCKVG
ncbi:MAG: proton-conducting transporter membrane subunit [Desulfovibrionaceae bacterium]